MTYRSHSFRMSPSSAIPSSRERGYAREYPISRIRETSTAPEFYDLLMTRLTSVNLEDPEGFAGTSTREGRRLSVLMEVCRTIGTIHDQPALMNAIMQQVTQVFGADRSTVYLHDPARRVLWTLVAQGLDPSGELRVPDDQGLCGYVFRSNRPLRVADTLKTPYFAQQVAERTGYRPRSMLIVPLPSRGERCPGVLQVMDRRVGRFGNDDLLLLEAIAVQAGIALENAWLYAGQKRQFESFVHALSAALDARDPLTAIHSINVANYAMGIGEVLGLNPKALQRLRIAGLVHDIGKIGVREAVLTKPGKLTAEEYAEMQRHTEHSRRILSQIEFIEELQGVQDVAAAHHERIDGSGYPQGLAGGDISLQARILAVADVFDALTQDRHYRRGMTNAEAFRVVDEMTPHALDRACVAALKTFMGGSPEPPA